MSCRHSIDDTKQLLGAAGYSDGEIDDILEGRLAPMEWSETSDHLREVVAAFQECSWISADFSGGAL